MGQLNSGKEDQKKMLNTVRWEKRGLQKGGHVLLHHIYEVAQTMISLKADGLEL